MPILPDDSSLLAALLACYADLRDVRYNDVARRLGRTPEDIAALLADDALRARISGVDRHLGASVERLVARSRRLREINRGLPAMRAADQSAEYVRRALAEGLPMPDDAYYDAPLPATPTAAHPGSAAKIAEMARRATRFEVLIHPQDGGESLD
jgi:hypothetical protein